MPNLGRHAEAIHNVTLPAGRLAFHLGHAPGLEQVGWVMPDAIPLLLRHGCTRAAEGIILPEPSRLPDLARNLADEGTFPWRREAFDVRADPDGPVLATVDRGALPWFGIMAQGVHVNGLVRRADGLHLWVARRAANRLLDPGKLDHLFAGGIATGFTAAETLVKEAAEEAGLSADLAARARFAGLVSYTSLRAEGLRRDRLHCYDLYLPESVLPIPADGEVAGFELWPMPRVIDTLADTDDFKFNVAVVVVDMLHRLGFAVG